MKEKKNIRIIQHPRLPKQSGGQAVSPPATLRVAMRAGSIKHQDFDYKKVYGGFLVQERDNKLFEKLKVVTRRKPTVDEIKTLKFAWKVVKNVKSNAIVIAAKNQTLSIGAGQMSRVDAVKIAIMKMPSSPRSLSRSFMKGRDQFANSPLVMASDAFFPFPDSIELTNKAGITAIIQPGGSLKDKAVISACNRYKIAMVFTGIRHFKH